MVLQIATAIAADVEDIAAIHLAAFDSNVLLHAQFPTASSLKGLRSILIQEMLTALQQPQDSGKSILVVRDTEANNRIISFAKWDLPGPAQTIHPGVTWPSDCRQEYLDQYHEKAEAAKSRVIGDKLCYRKICVSSFFLVLLFNCA
jgi:hypothetical protein